MSTWTNFNKLYGLQHLWKCKVCYHPSIVYIFHTNTTQYIYTYSAMFIAGKANGPDAVDYSDERYDNLRGRCVTRSSQAASGSSSGVPNNAVYTSAIWFVHVYINFPLLRH